MAIPSYLKDSRVTLAGVQSRVLDLHRRLAADLQTARTYQDPHLSAEGLEARRQQLAEQARARHAATLEGLKATVSTEARVIGEFAQKQRPRLGEDAVSMQRSQLKWDQVRMRLDAGMSLRQVVATADRETLAAIAEWAPVWLEAEQHRNAPAGLEQVLSPTSGPDLTGLRNAVDARLAEIGGEDVAWAVRADQEARSVVAGFEPMARHLERLCAGVDSDPLVAAMESRMEQSTTGVPLGATEGSDAA